MSAKVSVDWSMLIHELRFTHGMTMTDIGTRVSLSRESIRLYYNRDTSPTHRDGEKLISLWMETTCKTREAIPFELTAFSAASMR